MSSDWLGRLSPADRLQLLAFDAEFRRLPRPLLDALWAGVDALVPSCCLSRKLGREDLGFLDNRRLREEVGRSRHQRRGDPARKVGLPARVVREGRRANHVVVPGSSWTIDRPPRRKLATSASLPGFASSRTNSATVTMP